MSSLVCLCQNFVRLPASVAPAVCQPYLQCESDGLEGFGCHDSPLRVHEHPHQTDGSTARSTGALLSQPAPRTAAADQSYCRESALHSQVRLNRDGFIKHLQAFKMPCVFIHQKLSLKSLFPVPPQLTCVRCCAAWRPRCGW